MTGHPDADVAIDEPLIRRLLTQHPVYAALPVRFAAHGFDNDMWRLGDHLALRLPRRAEGVPLIVNELRWLPWLAVRLPLPISAAVAEGRPTDDYPYPWAVVPWLDGVPATTSTPAQRDEYAGDLAAFLGALHVPAPPQAPLNPVRGVPMAERDATVRRRLEGRPDGDVLLGAWQEGLDAAAYDGPPLWMHGDPHPYNCLVRAPGELAAVVDFGDLTVGDPASDLAVAWAHFTRTGRDRFRERLAIDDATWLRARGWAASYAAIFSGLTQEHPLRAVGLHMAREIAEGQG